MLICNVSDLGLTVQAKTRKEVLKILAERMQAIIAGEGLKALESRDETHDHYWKRARRERDSVLAFLGEERLDYKAQLETPGQFARHVLLKLRRKEPLALKFSAWPLHSRDGS